jgi:metal-dependent hydrolase (beta-lactamase superfamily II)
MADVLKVLMMGGQRAGKTSVLAGLIDSMTNGSVKDIIEVRNTTESSDVNQKLAKSIESLKWHLITSLGKTFLIDDGKTSILYDTGFGFTGDKVANNIKAVLKERKLDYIFLTHSHYDHALGSA